MYNYILEILNDKTLKAMDKMLKIKAANIRGNTNESMLIQYIDKKVYNPHDYIRLANTIVNNNFSLSDVVSILGY